LWWFNGQNSHTEKNIFAQSIVLIVISSGRNKLIETVLQKINIFPQSIVLLIIVKCSFSNIKNNRGVIILCKNINCHEISFYITILIIMALIIVKNIIINHFLWLENRLRVLFVGHLRFSIVVFSNKIEGHPQPVLWLRDDQ